MGFPNYSHRTVEAAGHWAHVVEVGEGPLVVLIGSMVATWQVYRPLVDELSRRYRVMLIETPGSGQSSTVSEPWTLPRHARWLSRMLEENDLQPTVLIGHSNSGPLALLVAARVPHRVRRVVVAGSIGACFSPSLPRFLLFIAIDAMIEWRFALRTVWHLARNLLVHPANFVHQLRIALQTDVMPVARHVRVPVLIAWGRRDHMTPLRCAHRLFEHLPRSQLYVSQKGSHDWIIDRAAEFVDVMGAFILRTEPDLLSFDIPAPLPAVDNAT